MTRPTRQNNTRNGLPTDPKPSYRLTGPTGPTSPTRSIATSGNKDLFRPALANVLCRPSYLSGLWALGFYGLIPEQVRWFTSVTTRGPQKHENPFGVFEYGDLKQSAERWVEIQERAAEGDREETRIPLAESDWFL